MMEVSWNLEKEGQTSRTDSIRSGCELVLEKYEAKAASKTNACK